MASGELVVAREGRAKASVALSARSLTLAVTMLAIVAVAIRQVVDPDVWWHMATGRYIVAQGRIPALDVFSFTASDHQWVTHEWLSDLALYGGYRLVGFAGLVLLFAGVIAAAYALVWLRCRGKPVLASCSVLLAALAATPTYGVRPQMFSLFFASLFLYILDRAHEGRRVWLLPPLALLWANLHSGFVAGLAIVAVFAAGEQLDWLQARTGKGAWVAPRAKQLGLVFLACAACTLVTPNGISAVLFPFGTLSNSTIQSYIEEWASPNYHESLAWPLGALWLVLLAALAVSRRRLRPAELLLLLGASAATMYSIRHVQFLSLVAAPIVAERVDELWSRSHALGAAERPASPLLKKALAGALVALVVIAGVRMYSVAGRTAEVESTLYPSAALAYMSEHGLGGRVFNTYHWGGYLIWHGRSVFIDGRAEVYGDEVLSEYVKARSVSSDWQEPFERYKVDVALMQSDSALAVVMCESGRWQVAYRDDVATVLTRAPSAQ